MIYLGMDPGQSGTVAALHNGQARTCKLSETPHDVHAWLEEVISQDGSCFAILERVSAMPRQGVSSTFKFGTSYGFCLGMLTALRIPYEQVTPGTWQRSLGCLSKGDKNVTKRKAQELFPQLKVIHATADALLLAEFCRRIINSDLRNT